MAQTRAQKLVRRSGSAGAVVLLHMLAALILVRAPPIKPAGPQQTEPFWITLAPRVPSSAAPPAPSPRRATGAPSRGAVPQSRRLPAQAEMPQGGTAPPALAGSALQDYLVCGLGTDAARPRHQQERCQEIRRGLHREPIAVRTAPTEAEIRTERRLARELAIQNAPVLIPCAGGVGLDIVCVVDRAINGADRVYDSYVDHPPKPKALGERPPANLAFGPGRGRGKKK